MEQTYYLISDAAKQVQVESHVLRYWEEELKLPIKRNELGHRFYTEEDIARFISIKRLKEKGLQLKAIKLVLQDEESFEQELLGESEEKKEENGTAVKEPSCATNSGPRCGPSLPHRAGKPYSSGKTAPPTSIPNMSRYSPGCCLPLLWMPKAVWC